MLFMDQEGSAYIFINFEQAATSGHVGWGFAIGDGLFNFGSTDHLWNLDFPLWIFPS